jgi:starvation-inducible DNA-binding protein
MPPQEQPRKSAGAAFAPAQWQPRWAGAYWTRQQEQECQMGLHETHNSLASNTRTVSIRLLNARLADSIDLALATKQAHWNLRGPQFIAVHEMLDGLRATLDGHVDTLAERVAQLGGVALGTTQSVAAASTLQAYPTGISQVREHLASLIERYAHVANTVRAAIDEADGAGDAATADIFTAYSRDLDKALWFLEAHVTP